MQEDIVGTCLGRTDLDTPPAHQLGHLFVVQSSHIGASFPGPGRRALGDRVVHTLDEELFAGPSHRFDCSVCRQKSAAENPSLILI